jgi:hypothetical protein
MFSSLQIFSGRKNGEQPNFKDFQNPIQNFGVDNQKNWRSQDVLPR